MGLSPGDQVIDADQTGTTVAVTGARYEGYMVWINALVMFAGGEVLGDPGASKDAIPSVQARPSTCWAETNLAARSRVFDDPEVRQAFPMVDLILDSIDTAGPQPRSAYYHDVSAPRIRASFVDWVYRSVVRTMAPFRGMFEPLAMNDKSALDTSLLFAAIIYRLAALCLRSAIDWETERMTRSALEVTDDAEQPRVTLGRSALQGHGRSGG